MRLSHGQPGRGWLCHSASGMQCNTEDITVDPNDATQSTWYAAVWGEWGSPANLGGLYYATNRGVNWGRITTGLKAVNSCTFSSVSPDEMCATTEDQGLCYSANRRTVSPTFTTLAGYSFRFPTRVFFNPYDANEVWVTSFGNGVRLGRLDEPQPLLRSISNG